MNITFEQVEKLREYADVTYAEAKEALEACDGSLLDAIVYLEKQGKTKEASSNTSTGNASEVNYEKYNQRKENFKSQGKGLWQFIKRLFHKGMVNKFEVIKDKEVLLSIPVNLLLLGLVCFFWVVVPLLIIGLFLGCHYRFVGSDLGKEKINKVMDDASEMAENIKKSTMENSEEEKKNDTES